MDFQHGGAGNPPDPVKALLVLMGLPQRKALLEERRGAAPEGRVQKHQLRDADKNISTAPSPELKGSSVWQRTLARSVRSPHAIHIHPFLHTSGLENG